MKRLLACAALVVAGFGFFAAFDAPAASADPGPQCQFLGQNFNVWYDCLNPPPWVVNGYGGPNNPPLGGSAVTPGGDGPTVNGREPGWSGPDCPACSS